MEDVVVSSKPHRRRPQTKKRAVVAVVDHHSI
jgi:hypothetical protein